MKSKIVMCAVALSLALLQSASAARPVKIGFGGGMSVPVSDAQNAFKNGFHGTAMVQWEAPVLPVALRGSVGYSQLDIKSAVTGASDKAKILSGLANVSYAFPVGPVKPYIIAGVGAFNIKTDVGGTSSPSSTKFGIDGGAGMQFKLGGVAGFVEGKVENIFTDQGLSSAIGSTQEFKTLIIPVTFGILF
jgi:outer membrane protein with beta-barrel domain